MELLKTPLYSDHIKLNAKLMPFGKWQMPINYPTGIIYEASHCRKAASVFDTCHMGQIYFKGDIALSGIEEPFAFFLHKLLINKGKYGFLLNEKAGILDDVICFRLSEDELLIVVNADTQTQDFEYIKSFLKPGCVFKNLASENGKIDLQGPLALNVLEDLFSLKIVNLPYFGIRKIELLGEACYISRTGYTGELGYEIYFNRQKILDLWQILLTHPQVKPAGLGARDILRLEMGYSLYEVDLDETLTPLEANLGNFVDFSKDFIGKIVLLKQKQVGLAKIKIAFKTNSKRTPRSHYQICFNQSKIGYVTSGVYSPNLGYSIGLGYIDPKFFKIGQKIEVIQDQIKIEAEICELPFLKGTSLRRP